MVEDCITRSKSCGLGEIDAPCHFKLRCIVVGDAAVGKSCLLLRFARDEFRRQHDMTIGVDFASRTVDVDGTQVKFQIWDTAGQEAFRCIVRSFFRGAAAVLLVYDVTRRATLEHVRSWLDDVRGISTETPTVVLVGNKCDAEEAREVGSEEGHAFANEHGLLFVETSAKEKHNVAEAFLLAARDRISRGKN